jgi:DNA-binding response OmpR family regulator
MNEQGIPPAFTAIVAEDEPQMASIIAFALETEGFTTEVVTNGIDALERIAAASPSVAVLDVMMPRLDGLSVCRQLRASDLTKHVPILIVTAKAGTDEVITGLEAGADDYIGKPFHPRELALRAAALARRTQSKTIADPRAGLQLRSRRVHVDESRFEATLDGQPLRLTTNETRLLSALVAHPGEALSWEGLLRDAWGVEAWDGGREMVKAAVYRLRHKLGDDPNEPQFIVAVRGVGYRFLDP